MRHELTVRLSQLLREPSNPIAHRRGARAIGVQQSRNSAGADFTIKIQNEVLDFVGLVPGRSAMLEIVKNSSSVLNSSAER